MRPYKGDGPASCSAALALQSHTKAKLHFKDELLKIRAQEAIYKHWLERPMSSAASSVLEMAQPFVVLAQPTMAYAGMAFGKGELQIYPLGKVVAWAADGSHKQDASGKSALRFDSGQFAMQAPRSKADFQEGTVEEGSHLAAFWWVKHAKDDSVPHNMEIQRIKLDGWLDAPILVNTKALQKHDLLLLPAAAPKAKAKPAAGPEVSKRRKVL